MEDELNTSCNKPAILITGFGPFDGADENACTKILEIMACLKLGDELGVNIKTYTLNTEYKCVLENIPQCWDSYKPKLVIHLGESWKGYFIKLEKRAYNHGYIRRDVQSCLPCDGFCIKGGSTLISTGLDLEAVAEEANNSGSPLNVGTSSDAGRYLCEFVFYRSLCIDSSRVVFIHIPDVRSFHPNSENSFKEIANSLAIIIKLLYRQVVKADQSKTLCN